MSKIEILHKKQVKILSKKTLAAYLSYYMDKYVYSDSFAHL